VRDELDLLYLCWQATLGNSADQSRLLGEAEVAHAGVVRDAAAFLKGSKVAAVQRRLVGGPVAHPRSSLVGKMLEALSALKLPPSLRPFVQRASGDAPPTHVFDHLLNALHEREEWSAMLAVVNARLDRDDSIFMPWLQKSIALQNLARTSEAKAAIQKAQRLHPRHPDVVRMAAMLRSPPV
jgi:hypothetical protein